MNKMCNVDILLKGHLLSRHIWDSKVGQVLMLFFLVGETREKSLNIVSLSQFHHTTIM